MKNYFLQANEIHAWVIDLNAYKYATCECWTWLNEKEKLRANRFAFESLKERYVLSHGFVNKLIACYLNTTQFKINFGLYGKPIIENSFLHFNLSHSHQYATLLFAKFEIGVDIEYIKNEDPLTSIFSEKEKRFFNEIPDNLKSHAFYKAWVRKESYLKAIGLGICQEIQSIEVGFETPSEWDMIPFAILDSYVGCITTKKQSNLKIRWCGIRSNFFRNSEILD